MLSEAAGNAVSKVTRLIQLFGSTEIGGAVLHYTDPEDWRYLAFDAKYNGIDWRAAGDDLYEAVIVRRPEAAPYQAVFTVFPTLTEWPMGDFYSKHPTKADHWLYQGRIDDMICFAHGVKYRSTDYESRLGAHPLIQFALMIGDKRSQPCLLLELERATAPANDEDRRSRIENIWPTIAAANEEAPSIAQVAKTHVLFATPDKPFLRTAKGTVQRSKTIELYENEINHLYEVMGDKASPMVTRVKG